MTRSSSTPPTTMANASGTSRFKKLFHTGKKNPYTNPHHPNHNPTSGAPSHTFRPQPPAASPRGSFDYLAEAREVAGRDSVTGRPLQGSRAQSVPPHLQRGQQRPGNRLPSANETHTAYQDRNRGVRQTTGTRYDMFVQEMKGRKLEGGVGLEPRDGYYAPERRVVEFYGNGGEPLVRGGEWIGR